MALHTLTGSGSPVGVVTPDYLGQHYVDTGTNTIYQAYSTTSADWSANLTAANIRRIVDDKSGAYTIVAGDLGKVINVDATAGAVTLTLTAAATMADGFWCYVRKADSSANAVTIDPNAAETINGGANISVTAQYEMRLLVCDGTTWFMETDASSGGASTTFSGLIENLEISTSRAGNAETIALKTAAGSDPSGSDKIRIGFRDATAGTGAYSVLEISAATSITVSSGSTLGATSATIFRLWLVGFNDAGTFRLGVIKCALTDGVYGLQDNVLESSTAEGGAGAADSSGVIYTGTGVTSKAMRVLGYLEYTLTTAGTWDTAPSLINIYSQGDRLPGETVQVRRNQTGATASGTTTIPSDDTIPQNTEGTEFMTQAITPRSAANMLHVHHSAFYSLTATASVIAAVFQDTTANALAVRAITIPTANYISNVSVDHLMLAGTTSATTFKIRAGGNNASTIRINGGSGARFFGGVAAAVMQVTETMV
jgi:hypothetical protein